MDALLAGCVQPSHDLLHERSIILNAVKVKMICDRGNQAQYLLPSKVTEATARLHQTIGLTIQRQTVLFKQGKTS